MISNDYVEADAGRSIRALREHVGSVILRPQRGTAGLILCTRFACIESSSFD